VSSLGTITYSYTETQANKQFLTTSGYLATKEFRRCKLLLDTPLPVNFANPIRTNWHVYKEAVVSNLSTELPVSAIYPQELTKIVCKCTEACDTPFKVACPLENPRGKKNPFHRANIYKSIFHRPSAEP